MSASSRWEHCADSTALEYFEHSADRTAPYQGVILIASALDVPARFYRAYANFMAMKGFTVLSFHYRGIGLSGQQADPGLIRLAQWGSQDLDTMIGKATKIAGSSPVYLVGHSIGGQRKARDSVKRSDLCRRIVPLLESRASRVSSQAIEFLLLSGADTWPPARPLPCSRTGAFQYRYA